MRVLYPVGDDFYIAVEEDLFGKVHRVYGAFRWDGARVTGEGNRGPMAVRQALVRWCVQRIDDALS
jgi:hypothetical protein